VRDWPEIVWLLGDGAMDVLLWDKPVPAEPLIDRAGRSTLAMESARMLLEHRGGDSMERAEFARLFAIGEPQEGLRAFLEKRKARFQKI
jgi:hypothetical protein